MKARLVLSVAAAALVSLLAGCGGDGGDSGSDPATLAPPQAPLYLQASVQPTGATKTNVEDLFERISGIDTNLGALIVSELESSAGSSGGELDFEKEIEPWLGERGGLFFRSYDGDDFSGYGIAVQSTDVDATQAFIDKQAEEGDEPSEPGSYEGVDFVVESDDGTTVGVIGDFIAVAEDESTFKTMVDASGGESLAGEDDFSSAIEAAPDGSFADVFVDVGRLLDQSGDSIDPDARRFLDSAGIDPEEATAVASLIPGSDQVEIDVGTDLGGENPPTGNASDLLASLPGDSAAAIATADFGKRLGTAIDEIDAEGIAGEVPPREFKSTLEQAGIDVEEIASSIDDLAVFAQGETESDLDGAAVLSTSGSKEAANTVSNVGLLLRASGTPGVTAISGKASGFSVRSDDLGPKPLVVAAKGERIVIAYGLPAARRALADGGETLGQTSAYKEAVSALGGTAIAGFADGPAALKLATALVSPSEQGFREARPYLAKIDYLAIGSGSADGLSTAKLIAGIAK